MTILGWLFLVASLVLVGSVTVWCYTKLLK